MNEAGADVLVTTEKDWVKIRHAGPSELGAAIWRVGISVDWTAEAAGLVWKTIAKSAGLVTLPGRASQGDENLWTE